MTNTPAPVNRIAKRLALTMDDYKDALKVPLRLLPDRVQPAALRLWACHKHLKGFETAISLAGMLSVWLSEFGLREDDAEAILKSFLSPHKMKSFVYAADLTTALASDVAEAIDRRSKEAKREAERRQAEEEKRYAITPEEHRSLMESLHRESVAVTVPQSDPEATARNAAFAAAARQNA